MIIPVTSHQLVGPEDITPWVIAISSKPTVHSTSRRTQAISFLLPAIIIVVFLLILIMTLMLAICLYGRFKATQNPSERNHTSWKSFYTSLYRNQGNSNSSNSDMTEEDENGMGEEERLLARRRSTSYYDANRSRAPVQVVIRQDSKGRPISTWSTASSVAAQRGEELSNWSRRRDDLIRIYGRSQINSYAEEDEDLTEEPEAEAETEAEQEQGQGQVQQQPALNAREDERFAEHAQVQEHEH